MTGDSKEQGFYSSPVTRHLSRLLRLGWLLPLTYAAHATEEWRFGFPAWWAALTGVPMPVGEFLWLNSLGLAAMGVGVALAYASPRARWLFVSFATVALVNACAHLAASAATRSYSPGVVTGSLLWLPLGATILRAARRALARRSFARGVAVGLAMHACVVLIALVGG